jgi:hypothetical protein
MIRYEFTDGPLPFRNVAKLDPQRMGEAVAEVRAKVARKERTGERLDKIEDSIPRLLYAAAVREADHPFAPVLERNEKRAAYLHNLSIIRSAIRTIRIVNEESGDKTPAFVHLSRGKLVEPGYKTAGDIIDSFSMQLAVWRLAERDLAAFERRYTQLTTLCDGVRKLREHARQQIDTIETTGARGDADQPEQRAAS